MKNLEHTDELRLLLRKEVGEDGDIDNLMVYEATVANQIPLRKNHPLYNGAVMEIETLHQMANEINRESVPLHIMHKSEEVLPIGRAFLGRVVDNELRALFFLPRAEEKIISSIETGVVNQVSLSALFHDIKCSECGFNFRGEESTLENVFTGTCKNGHVMGKDAHLKISNLQQWNELSLVGKGAAINARIHGKADSKLVASGDINNIFTLCATPTDKEIVVMEELKLQMEDFVVRVTRTIEELEAKLAAFMVKDTTVPPADESPSPLEEVISNASDTLIPEQVPTSPVSDPAAKAPSKVVRPPLSAFHVKN